MIPFFRRLATDLVFFASALIILVQVAGYVTEQSDLATLVSVGLAGMTGAKRIGETKT